MFVCSHTLVGFRNICILTFEMSILLLVFRITDESLMSIRFCFFFLGDDLIYCLSLSARLQDFLFIFSVLKFCSNAWYGSVVIHFCLSISDFLFVLEYFSIIALTISFLPFSLFYPLGTAFRKQSKKAIKINQVPC